MSIEVRGNIDQENLCNIIKMKRQKIKHFFQYEMEHDLNCLTSINSVTILPFRFVDLDI
jgi:hypothetical protein